MQFDEIKSRLTGFSTPIFGMSWTPPESQHALARRVIIYLEDRRVLYAPEQMEIPSHCIESVVAVRGFITDMLLSPDTGPELEENLRAMRIACRKFLNRIGGKKAQILSRTVDNVIIGRAGFLTTPWDK